MNKLLLELENEEIEFFSINNESDGFTFAKNEYTNKFYLKISYKCLNIQNTEEIYNFYNNIKNKNILSVHILFKNNFEEEFFEIFSSNLKKLQVEKIKYDEGFDIKENYIISTILFDFSEEEINYDFS